MPYKSDLIQPAICPQLNQDGQLAHFLTIKDLPKQILLDILNQAEAFFDPKTGMVLDAPTLAGTTVANLFFEASTRTRSTFELAAKKLSANILNLNIQSSSVSKGESLLDTVYNLEAMHCGLFVVRHGTSGAAQFVAENVRTPVGVINAGDGRHAHPTQAMLDMYTIRKHRGADFSQFCVAIVGDVLHSRVARSQIHALRTLGAGEIRLIGPKTLLPSHPNSLGVEVFHDMKRGLAGVDIIIVLRLQLERMQGARLPTGDAFYDCYGLTQASLMHAKSNALIIHPGPINRGVEIQSEIADSPQAVILDQVTNGIAVRMAILNMVARTHQQASGANR